ncbi:MAG: S8 family serine peptidase [Desulfobacterales bacterium]|nr:S8 family serine peptidase [Desulfobacterales bacterium]
MQLMKRIGWLVFVCCPLLFWACGGGGGDSSAPPTYTISGTIMAAAGNQADSDVNDTGTVPVPNNSFDSAQSVSAPGIIGGYVNEAGVGAEGNSDLGGDTDDYFRVTLTANTTIRLALPDETTAHFTQVTLTVYDEAQVAVASAGDVPQYAVLNVDSAGDYYIRVHALIGATSYRLMIGSVEDLPQALSIAKSSDFVPGEVLVQLKADNDRTASKAAARDDFVHRTGLKKVHADAKGWMRLRADDRQTVFQRLKIPGRNALRQATSKTEATQLAKEETLSLVRALRQLPDVAHAQPNFIRRPYLTPNDPHYPLQWHLDMMHLPDAWDQTTGSNNVIVAVIDTGILSGHPDLSAKIVSGYDFISDPENARDGDGIDDDPEDPGDSFTGESSFHGSHTAGIIAASFDNGIGVAGVGGNTLIMPVRVLGPDGGTDADIYNAIRWAAGYDLTDGQGNVIVPGANPPADIINMSLGGPDDSDLLAQAVADAYDAGVLLFAASGNTPDGEPSYPAAYPEVFSVSAVDANGKIANYSNFGSTVFVAAPGGDLGADVQPDGYADGVLSTLGSDVSGPIEPIYSYMQGTSMASANVAGVAALMKAARAAADPANPLSYDDFYGYLANGWITSDLGAVGDDDFYGYGLIDAYQAVLAAEGGDPPAALAITPLSLRFDANTASATLYARHVGSGPLSLSALTVGTDWLTVAQSPNQEGVGDFGQYTVTVNRTDQAGGIYTDYIEFVTSANTVRIPVTMEVLPDRNASAATQYVQLIDADTDEPVAQQVLSPSNGRYQFRMEQIPPGNYYLISGSDLNNDFSILDQGEAVGGYRTLDDWVAFTVDRNRSGLNFVTGFNQWPFFLPSGLSAAGKRRP